MPVNNGDLAGTDYESLYQSVAAGQITSLILVIAAATILIFGLMFGISTAYRSARIMTFACRMRDEHAIRLAKTSVTLSVVALCTFNIPLMFIASSVIRGYNRTDWSSD